MNIQGRRIVACIDGSAMTNDICDFASWATNQTSGSLTLLNIDQRHALPSVEDLSIAVGLGTDKGIFHDLREDEQVVNQLLAFDTKIMLEAVRDRALTNHVKTLNISQLNGNFKNTLRHIQNEIDLLVVGVRGIGHDESAEGIGIHVAQIIRALHRPVLVVNGPFKTPNTIMLAFDGSETAFKTLDYACQSPFLSNASFHLVSVVSDSQTMDNAIKKAETLLNESAKEYVQQKLSGKVDEQLLTYIEQNSVDMTVMGAYSHNRIRAILLGSFTSKMLQQSNKPLFLVR